MSVTPLLSKKRGEVDCFLFSLVDEPWQMFLYLLIGDRIIWGSLVLQTQIFFKKTLTCWFEFVIWRVYKPDTLWHNYSMPAIKTGFSY